MILIAGIVGLSWAFQPAGDNTLLVHLRTGIDIWRTHTFPDADPYSYTAHGHQWILQSWLAEVIYGFLHAVAGTASVVIVNSLLLGVFAFGMASLARTGRMAWTFLYALVAIVLSCGNWSTRPTTFGFVAFLALVAVHKRSIWWTVPIGFLWINLHGSWPIGVLWLSAVAVGISIETRSLARRDFARLGAFLVATVVGGVANPVGWRLLTFPAVVFQKGQIFATIIEWKAPDFHSFSSMTGGFTLIAIIVSLFCLVHLHPTWRHTLPVLGLLALSMYSQRNLPYFAVALSFSLGVLTRENFALTVEGLRSNEGLRPKEVGKWGPVESFAVVLAVMLVVLQTARLVTQKTPYDFAGYPTAGVAYAESLGYFEGDRHVLMPDLAGCYRIFLRGDVANVFIDDRYDMYPLAFERDASSIVKVRANTQELLDSYGVAAVLFQKDRPLTAYLSVNSRWKLEWSDKNWALYVRS